MSAGPFQRGQRVRLVGEKYSNMNVDDEAEVIESDSVHTTVRFNGKNITGFHHRFELVGESSMTITGLVEGNELVVGEHRIKLPDALVPEFAKLKNQIILFLSKEKTCPSILRRLKEGRLDHLIEEVLK